MSETLQALTVRDFIEKFRQDENLFTLIPEFSFISPIATKVKERNCMCGLSADMNNTTAVYNEVVNELKEETINKLKAVFGYEKICFSIQSQAGYSVRCY